MNNARQCIEVHEFQLELTGIPVREGCSDSVMNEEKTETVNENMYRRVNRIKKYRLLGVIIDACNAGISLLPVSVAADRKGRQCQRIHFALKQNNLCITEAYW